MTAINPNPADDDFQVIHGVLETIKVNPSIEKYYTLDEFKEYVRNEWTMDRALETFSELEGRVRSAEKLIADYQQKQKHLYEEKAAIEQIQESALLEGLETIWDENFKKIPPEWQRRIAIQFRKRLDQNLYGENDDES